MKPIQKAFKIAQAGVCLAQEWQDTIVYTALVATVAIQAGMQIHAHGHFNPPFVLNIKNQIGFQSFWEYFRALYWASKLVARPN